MAYSPDFFRYQSGGSRRSADIVAPLVISLIKPTSVVDVGGGVGTWLRAFMDQGIDDVLGIDGEYVDRSALQIPADRFMPADLTQPLTIDRRFDLVVSLEVGEHLPVDAARTYVESLVGLGPVVLFSAAIPGQGGQQHLNEQWPAYWAAHFRSFGYVPIDCLRLALWNAEGVDWWYRQNAMLYVPEGALESLPALRDHVRADPFPLVHPGLYTQTLDRLNGNPLAVGLRLAKVQTRERTPPEVRQVVKRSLRRVGLLRHHGAN